jgi:hypothetical protein
VPFPGFSDFSEKFHKSAALPISDFYDPNQEKAEAEDQAEGHVLRPNQFRRESIGELLESELEGEQELPKKVLCDGEAQELELIGFFHSFQK